MFSLKESDLKLLCEMNYFPVPDNDDKIVFFGLRGCLPLVDDNFNFRKSQKLELYSPDYTFPRCTLGQWRTNSNFAIFPGSTVPHSKHIRKALDSQGQGANQLMTGYFMDYRQGIHKAGSSTGHEAFRQVGKLPIRRSGDDLDYDADDRIEYMAPFDNLHAAWSMGVNQPNYTSAGCQVVLGYPKCVSRDNQPDVGPWKAFKSNAYSNEKNNKSFDYILLNGYDAQIVALKGRSKLKVRLRFGSRNKSNDDLVSEVQRRLQPEFYEAMVDGDFGPRTLFAVLKFQSTKFGVDADDGIVGPITAEALEIGTNWPAV